MAGMHTDTAAATLPLWPGRPPLRQRWAAYKADRFPMARKRLPWVVVAGLALLVGSQHVALGWVWTESVPATLVLILKGTPPCPGELMAYAYEGQEIAGWRRGDTFIKYAAAMAGDLVQRDGRHFWALTRRGRVDLGVAKQVSRQGLPLAAAQAGPVPPGLIYAHAPHADALDSRYAIAGLVRREAVVGRAIVLF